YGTHVKAQELGAQAHMRDWVLATLPRQLIQLRRLQLQPAGALFERQRFKWDWRWCYYCFQLFGSHLGKSPDLVSEGDAPCITFTRSAVPTIGKDLVVGW